MSKRLYIGGLSHTITQKDLRDRFGKFGSVEDVELRTRNDDEGVPYKTFGYINITISDSDFKKCMTVLNKAKWKGGTLQIEPAKESPLQRLDQERQARTLAQDSPAKPPKDNKEKVLDSLRTAGVENFHMKAAVPGTEVPGHKEWVVSKFGRVLPVLNLRCGKGSKSRSMKYDPSKHSHNIKRLEAEPDTTSVAQLTWEVPGGDDDISKKRRGEFPPTQPWRPKRTRTEPDPASADAEQTNGLAGGHTAEEEIHSISQGAPGPRVEEDILEVVRADFLARSRKFNQGGKGEEEEYDSADTDELLASNKPPPSSLQENARKRSLPSASGRDQKRRSLPLFQSPSSDEEDEEDKDNTDALKPSDPKADMSQQSQTTISRLKPSPVEDRNGEVEAENDEEDEVEEDSNKESENDEQAEVESDHDDEEEGDVESDHDEEADVVAENDQEAENDKDGDVEAEKDDEEEGNVESNDDEGSDEESDHEEEGDIESDGDDDSDYEAIFSNCTRLEISLADLQRIAKEAETTTPSMPQPPGGGAAAAAAGGPAAGAPSPRPKKGTTPEEILASLLEDDSGDDDRNNKKKKKKKRGSMAAMLPAFQGTSGLLGEKEEEKEEEGGGTSRRSQEPAEPCRVSQRAGTEPEPQEKVVPPPASTQKVKGGKVSVTNEEEDSSSSEEEEEVEKEAVPPASTRKMKGGKVSVTNEEADDDSSSEEEEVPPASIQKNKTSNISVTNEEEEEDDSSSEEEEVAPPASTQKIKGGNVSVMEDDDDDDSSSEEEEEVPPASTQKIKGGNMSVTKADEDDSSSSEEEEEVGVTATATASHLSQENSSSSSSEEEEEEDEEVEQQVAAAAGPDRVLDPKRQLLDNKKRLQAVVQRHQATQNQRSLIQGALASLDTSAAAPGQHIVFGSDEEEEEPDEAAAPANCKAPLKEKDLKKASGSKLFEDEEDEGEGDDDRFLIKPQFEGRAGRKLMAIQSGFGIDDRFRMDSRFAESDEEGEEEEKGEATGEVVKSGVEEEEECLDEERKTNLSILQSVLNDNPQLNTKPKAVAKTHTFRDVQALHYDPSRQEHEVFEDKMEDAAKEGKASRKKKKQKAAELPEVSKEMYYDVSAELKGVFGGGAPGGVAAPQEAPCWDRQEEAPEEEEQGETQGEAKEELSVFKFSFFQEETPAIKETEYRVEAIKEPRVSWQLESGFHDSSDEDEDEAAAAGVDDEEKVQQNSCDPAEESVMSCNRELFFYYPEDSRLTDGPLSFCRSTLLKENDWEEKRNALIQDCRNTHKKARRKCTKKR
ncbi:nucleolar protein 8 isoform X2 [Gadus macrocephalus]|uniref:nucleolar protein 8 isoform X2 n=1 Tax=Gadus macrocephalus TaxID=80720 RepID=UPI0028CB3F0A|nr:nucleolar protein 8 isoform X2 [Gadus macrocephalus]